MVGLNKVKLLTHILSNERLVLSRLICGVLAVDEVLGSHLLTKFAHFSSALFVHSRCHGQPELIYDTIFTHMVRTWNSSCFQRWIPVSLIFNVVYKYIICCSPDLESFIYSLGLAHLGIRCSSDGFLYEDCDNGSESDPFKSFCADHPLLLIPAVNTVERY